MSTTESEFEEIGFSDCESVQEGTCSSKEEKVIVQLPPDLLARDHVNPNSAASAASSVASSFVPVMRLGSLAIRSVDDQKSTTKSIDSSWSHVECTTGPYRSDSPSVAGSIISGFDILSIGGSNHRRCRRCTFLNDEGSGVCGSCEAALVANPCPDIDHQIALNLQKKEEEHAFLVLQEEERKRKTLHLMLPLQQAEALAAEIIDNVISVGEHGVATLPRMDLTIHLSQFIQSAREMDTKHIRLHYHFSTALSTGLFGDIRVSGFRPPCTVSKNIEAAYFKKDALHDARNRFSSGLQCIPEDQPLDHIPKLGWIVATLGQGNLRSVGVSSGVAELETFHNHCCVPLVSFDASLRTEDVVRRLMNVMSRSCHDFFWFLNDHSEEESPCKRQRAETETPVPDLAASLHEPLYELDIADEEEGADLLTHLSTTFFDHPVTSPTMSTITTKATVSTTMEPTTVLSHHISAVDSAKSTTTSDVRTENEEKKKCTTEINDASEAESILPSSNEQDDIVEKETYHSTKEDDVDEEEESYIMCISTKSYVETSSTPTTLSTTGEVVTNAPCEEGQEIPSTSSTSTTLNTTGEVVTNAPSKEEQEIPPNEREEEKSYAFSISRADENPQASSIAKAGIAWMAKEVARRKEEDD